MGLGRHPRLKAFGLGRWFAVLAGLGRSDVIPFLLLDSKGRVLRDFSYHHRFGDGRAALGAFGRELGGVALASRHRGQVRPRPWQWPSLFLRAMKSTEASTVEFLPWSLVGLPDKTKDFSPAPVISFRFSGSFHAHLSQYLLQHKTSFLVLGLSTLHRALLQSLEKSPGSSLDQATTRWLVPVDLREGATPVKQECEVVRGNCVGYVTLNLDNDNRSLSAVRAQLIAKLRANEAWVSWLAHAVTANLGAKSMTKLAKASRQRWTGTFSDLGTWSFVSPNPQTTDQMRDSSWLVTPPGGESSPLSVCHVIWNDVRSLSFRLHPSWMAGASSFQSDGLNPLQPLSQQILQVWIRELACEVNFSSSDLGQFWSPEAAWEANTKNDEVLCFS